MFNMNSVQHAIAPLAKVQANLEKVMANRQASAADRREAAKEFTLQAQLDERQEAQARAILVNLDKLLAPTED